MTPVRACVDTRRSAQRPRSGTGASAAAACRPGGTHAAAAAAVARVQREIDATRSAEGERGGTRANTGGTGLRRTARTVACPAVSRVARDVDASLDRRAVPRSARTIARPAGTHLAGSAGEAARAAARRRRAQVDARALRRAERSGGTSTRAGRADEPSRARVAAPAAMIGIAGEIGTVDSALGSAGRARAPSRDAGLRGPARAPARSAARAIPFRDATPVAIQAAVADAAAARATLAGQARVSTRTTVKRIGGEHAARAVADLRSGAGATRARAAHARERRRTRTAAAAAMISIAVRVDTKVAACRWRARGASACAGEAAHRGSARGRTGAAVRGIGPQVHATDSRTVTLTGIRTRAFAARAELRRRAGTVALAAMRTVGVHVDTADALAVRRRAG